LISLDSLNLDSQSLQVPAAAAAANLQDSQLLQLPVSSNPAAAAGSAGLALSQYNPFAAASAARAGGSPAR
jgi:hypothetical protein